jgi:6-pyruvoyl-tetrahydropterin synthase
MSSLKSSLVKNQSKIKIQKGLIIQKIDNQTVIFDADQSILYTLNETASIIFDKLKKNWDKQKIINYMLKKFAVKKERLEKDFHQLLKDLKDKKIIA